MQIDKLGDLRATISGDVKDLTAGIALAKKDIKGFGRDMPGWVAPVGTAMVAAGAVVTGALTKMVFDAGKMGDEFDKLSLRTGIAVGPLSELSYAVKIAGSDTNALETSVRFLNRRMDEAGQGIGIAVDAFDRLGVEVVDADGSMRDSVTVMMEVADGIVGLTEESERGALAMDIFGARSGPQLLPLLKQGSAGIQELRNQARDLGLTMSTEAAAASAKFQDSLTDVRESAKMASFELGSVFIPVATDLIDKVTGVAGWFSRLSDTEQKIVGWGTASGAALTGVAGAGLLVVSRIPAILTGFGKMRELMTTNTRLASGLSLSLGGLGLAGATTVAFLAIKNWNAEAAQFREEQEELKKRVNEATVEFIKQEEAIEGAGTDLGLFTHRTIGSTEALKANVEAQQDQNQVRKDIEAALGVALVSEEELIDKQIRGADSTEDLNAALSRLLVLRSKSAETTKQAILDIDDIKDAEKSYFDISGAGWDAGEIQTRKFWETYRDQGNLSLEASRYVTSKLTNLMTGMYAAFKATAEAGTITEGEELGKRAILDEDYVDKIQANAARRLANASESLQNESGIVEGFFDWEVITAAERTAKLIAERGEQFNEELRLRAEYQASVDHLFEQQFLMAQNEEERLLELKNIAFQEEQAQFAERDKLMKFFLSNAGEQFKSAVDLQKDFSDKTEAELQLSYQRGVDAIDSTYNNFKASVERYSLDMVELDEWRAGQMLGIEKALTAAKVKELQVYSQTYAEHVQETSDFWGVGKGFKIPLSTGVHSGMSPEYKELLYGRDPSVVPTQPRVEPSSMSTGGSFTPTAAPTSKQGNTIININIANMNGGDESALNTFAEDIARRIKGQNITIW